MNGNIYCPEPGPNNKTPNYTDVNHYNACKDSDYNSTLRIQRFGVDCCILEAQNNMGNFSVISTMIKLDNNTVSLLACILQSV